MSTFLTCALSVIGIIATWKVCEWIGEDVQEHAAVKKEINAYGTAEAGRRQSQNTMARAVRQEDRRELSARVKGDMDRRRDQAAARQWTGFDTTVAQPHIGPQRSAHGAVEGGVGNEGAYVGTRLTYTPKDAA